MTVTDKLRSVIDYLTSGFDDKDDNGYYDNIVDETSYKTEDNLALAQQPVKQRERDLKVVVDHPYKGYEVLICEPRSYDESVAIVKHLKDRKSVILNLHLLDRELALRIVDFLCGATLALNGNQQKIGENVFIFTPVNVALSAESQKSKLIKDALWTQPQQQ
ncbi:MAG: cell division protein SepF [Candidatus Gastranaerophilaceae bacterium]